MRTIVDLEPSAVAALDRLARRDVTSRAAQLRLAVAVYLHRQSRTALQRSFGGWVGVADGASWQRRLRTDWDA